MSRRVLERWDWACYVAPGRLTGAQRSILQVIARHGEAFVSQEEMAKSAGIGCAGLSVGDVDTSPVRKVLRRLKAMGLIEDERRPGKTTIWRPRLDWTPVREDRSQLAADPGPTPVQPRSSGTYEGEGEGATPLSLNGNAARAASAARDAREREGEREQIEFDPRNLVTLRRIPS
jgi:hypothetical protein